MEEYPINLRLLNFVSNESLLSVREYLKRNGFLIFELNGAGVTDAASFFAEVVQLLPQDPVLSGRVNWDAFSDSLRGGLDDLREERVAFLWTRVERMLEHGLEDLITAVQCLSDVALSIRTTKHGMSQPVELLVFLLGDGANFKPFGNHVNL